MSETDKKSLILRKLKESHLPEAFWPAEWEAKKKRPKEIAFMDINLCYPCGKCPEFCPVGCIEQLQPNTIPGRGANQPVQVRADECIGCYICVEVCAVLTDYDAVRMYPTDTVEKLLDVKIGETKPDAYIPAEPYEEFFSEGGDRSIRDSGKGSRILERIAKDDHKKMSE